MNVAIVYWSGTGNTEKMANIIADELKSKNINVDIFFSDDFTKDNLKNYNAIAFGCPAMGNEVLEETSFEPMFSEIENELNGKKIAIFGSYEWNDGQWMRDWEKRVEEGPGIVTYEGVAGFGSPNEETKNKLKELANSLIK